MSFVDFIRSLLAPRNYRRHPCRTDETIFTEDTSLSMNSGVTGLNNHVLVVGTSGTGKTRYFIEPNILQGNASFVIADAKGGILKDCGKSLEEMGYKIRVLNLHDLEQSMNYNPFHYIHTQDDILYLATYITACTVTGDGKTQGGDPFWQDASRMILCFLIAMIHYCSGSSAKQNLSELLGLLSWMKRDDPDDTTAIDAFIESRIKHVGDDYVIRLYNQYKSVAGADKTEASILITAAAAMFQWTSDNVRSITRYDEMELDMLDEEKTALFVIYDDMDRTKNFLSNILYSQLFKVLARKADSNPDGKLKRPVRVFLDDFASMIIPGFMDIISNIRSRDVSLVLIVQDESQLRHNYGDDGCSTIVCNCSSYLLTGTTNLDTAHELTRRFRISADSILDLPVKQFACTINNKPHFGKRFDPRRHKNYIDESFDLSEYLEETKNDRFKEACRRLARKDMELMIRMNTEKCRAEDDPAPWGHAEEENEVTEDDRYKYYLYGEGRDYLLMGASGNSFIKEPPEKGEPVPVWESSSPRKRKTSECLPPYIFACDTEFRDSVFDSKTEKEFYEQLLKFLAVYGFDSKITVDIHRHLNEVFSFKCSDIMEKKEYFALMDMHCDFILREAPASTKIYCGIEIDGPQHLTDILQQRRDNNKDRIFNGNDVPLLRVQACEVDSPDSAVWSEKLLDILKGVIPGTSAASEFSDEVQRFPDPDINEESTRSAANISDDNAT